MEYLAQGSGVAVAQTIADAGYDIPVVCTGFRNTTKQAIEDGILHGTRSSLRDRRHLRIELALKIVAGEELPAS